MSPPEIQFLYLSLSRLDTPSWFGTQRFASTLAKRHPVLFVEAAMSLREARGSAPQRRAQQLRTVSDNLEAFGALHWLPFGYKLPPVAALNTMILRRQLARLMARRPNVPVVVWIDDPHRAALIDAVKPACVVYNILHEFSVFGPAQGGADEGAYEIIPVERALLERADFAIAETETRAARKRAVNPHTYHVSHGVDWDLFKTALDQPRIPDDISALPRPRIGFSGSTARAKTDFDMLRAMADKHPDWSLVFVGRISRGGYTGVDESGIPADFMERPNVHFLGERPHTQVPHYQLGFDVCIMPYLMNRITRDIQTVKIFEYLASGKPVVAPPMPALLGLQPEVTIAEPGEAFLRAVEQAVAGDDPALPAKRLERAHANRWDRRIEIVLDLIYATLAGKDLPRPGHA